MSEHTGGTRIGRLYTSAARTRKEPRDPLEDHWMLPDKDCTSPVGIATYTRRLKETLTYVNIYFMSAIMALIAFAALAGPTGL